MRAINLIYTEPEFSLFDALTGEDCEPPVRRALRAAWIFMLVSLVTTAYLVLRANF